MKQNLFLIATIVLAMTVCISVDGKHLKLRPMSAREVYQALREAGREDAVPEGRVISQGLAAIKGFALGITKGVGGSLLFDLVTSNATTEMLNSLNYSALVPDFNAINYTALLPDFNAINFTALLPPYNLTALFGKGGNSTNTTITFTQQEICFSSRSLNDINDNGEVVDADEEIGQFRQDTPTTPTTGTTPPTTPTTPTTTNPGTTTSVSPTTTNPSTGTSTASPTSSPTTTNPGSGTSSPTTSATTITQTPPSPPATNCIVIKKPI